MLDSDELYVCYTLMTGLILSASGELENLIIICTARRSLDDISICIFTKRALLSMVVMATTALFFNMHSTAMSCITIVLRMYVLTCQSLDKCRDEATSAFPAGMNIEPYDTHTVP